MRQWREMVLAVCLMMAGLHAEVQDEFNRYGVQIMSPNFEAQPDGGAVVVPQEDWHKAPAAPTLAPGNSGIGDTPGQMKKGSVRKDPPLFHVRSIIRRTCRIPHRWGRACSAPA